MAAASSSSSSRMSCFQCQDSSTNSDHFRNGWRLRSGEFAQLCPRCASVFDDGRFCETFHSSDDGWRDCESCGKLVHCGCIVSFSTHLLLDLGGIICMECSRLNFILARKRRLSLESEVRARESCQKSSEQAPVEAPFWPRVTDSELQKVSRNPKATVTPLFEKILSASDTDLKLARLIIPKRCAENFFPDISGLHGLRIKIQDIDGDEWEFHYRYWLTSGSRTYVLEGLRDYMVSKKWQTGDTVTFYRVEPGGKVVMGLRKSCGGLQLHWYDISIGSCSNDAYFLSELLNLSGYPYIFVCMNDFSRITVGVLKLKTDCLIEGF